ncbi:MAG: class I SAM-dependent methyltransferase [Anaerolineae bacterium]
MSLRSEGIWWDVVRFGFRLLYHEMAFTYDLVSAVVSLGQWRCWQRTALPYLPAPSDGVVLEIAHGTGNLQLDLKQEGYQTVAYDYSVQMGKIAQSKLTRHGLDGLFVRGQAQQLPFASNSFCAIVCTFPTHFIVQEETLREAYRVLQVGGVMVIVLNGVLRGNGMIERGLEWLYHITGQREQSDKNTSTYFEGYDFIIETTIVDCERSQAQLVILRK